VPERSWSNDCAKRASTTTASSTRWRQCRATGSSPTTAELVGPESVYSVEYREELAEDARQTLGETGYGDVSVRVGDGRNGWPEHAPYDRAYLTCAAPTFPPAVVEQVRPGGLLLAPIGGHSQRLVSARRRADGSLDRKRHGSVRFVPLQ